MAKTLLTAIQSRPRRTRSPSKSNRTTVGYKDLKKFLNKYHTFTFESPRAGKDFTPQQKSSITYHFNKLAPLIIKVNKHEMSFINTSKLKRSEVPKHDGIKTSKGFFFKFAFTTIKKIDDKFYKYYERDAQIDYIESLDISAKQKNSKIKRLPESKKINVIYTDFRLVNKINTNKSSDIQQIYFSVPKQLRTVDGIDFYREVLESVYKPSASLLNAYGKMWSSVKTLESLLQDSGKNITLKKGENESDVHNWEERIEEVVTAVLLWFY